MPGDAGGSSWIRWEMLRILRRRGSNHLETLTSLTDCTLSCCHHGWNRIRSFVLGNHAETKSALPSLADGKEWKKQDKTYVLQRVNNWLLVGGITSLSSSLIDSNFYTQYVCLNLTIACTGVCLTRRFYLKCSCLCYLNAQLDLSKQKSFQRRAWLFTVSILVYFSNIKFNIIV